MLHSVTQSNPLYNKEDIAGRVWPWRYTNLPHTVQHKSCQPDRELEENMLPYGTPFSRMQSQWSLHHTVSPKGRIWAQGERRQETVPPTVPLSDLFGKFVIPIPFSLASMKIEGLVPRRGKLLPRGQSKDLIKLWVYSWCLFLQGP